MRWPGGWPRSTPRRSASSSHRNPFELLAATILSAQTTDQRVNMVTPALFARYPTPEALAAADPAEVEEIIRSTGFYQNKTRSLLGMANAVVERFGGEVPSRLEDLVTLPGVGRKTGNVVRSVAFGLPGLPVDTHVVRLSNRLGLTTKTDPVKIEMDLNAMVPAEGPGRLQPPADPARPAGLLRPHPGLRALRAGRHLPVSTPSDQPRRHDPSQRLRCRQWLSRMASTNQVPATWFAGDTGIRRLVSQERRPPRPGPSPFSAPCRHSSRRSTRSIPPLGVASAALGPARRHRGDEPARQSARQSASAAARSTCRRVARSVRSAS